MATISQLSIRSSPPTGVIIARRVMSVSTSAYSENENSNTPSETHHGQPPTAVTCLRAQRQRQNGRGMNQVVLRRCVPDSDALWRDRRLQGVRAKGASRHARGTEQARNQQITAH